MASIDTQSQSASRRSTANKLLEQDMCQGLDPTVTSDISAYNGPDPMP